MQSFQPVDETRPHRSSRTIREDARHGGNEVAGQEWRRLQVGVGDRIQPVTLVTGKVLIASIAIDHYGHVFTSHFGDVIERDGRGIRKRFAKVVGDFFQCRGNVAVLENKLVMIGGITLRHSPRIFQLGKRFFFEADRKRLDRRVAQLGHESHDDARVESAAQMRAERHLGYQAHLHRLLEQGAQLFDQFLFRSCVLGLVGEVPIAFQFCCAVLPDEAMRGRKLMDALIGRQRIGDVLQAQVQVDRFEIHLRLVRQCSKQRAQLGSKIQRLILDGVIDWLLAHAVARQEQLSVLTVP